MYVELMIKIFKLVEQHDRIIRNLEKIMRHIFGIAIMRIYLTF